MPSKLITPRAHELTCDVEAILNLTEAYEGREEGDTFVMGNVDVRSLTPLDHCAAREGFLRYVWRTLSLANEAEELSHWSFSIAVNTRTYEYYVCMIRDNDPEEMENTITTPA